MTSEHEHCYCIEIIRAGRPHLKCCGCTNVILKWGIVYEDWQREAMAGDSARRARRRA